MEKTIRPFICMGLARLIGGILFLVVSMSLFYWLNDLWQLNVRHMIDIQTIGWPAYKAFGLSCLGGLIALIIGQGIGSNIKIWDDDVSTHITVYWHYTINGAIIWCLASNAAASVSFHGDKDLLKAFYLGEGEDFLYWSLLFGGIMGALICTTLYFGAKKMQRSYYPGPGLGLFMIKIVPFLITMGLAWVHFNLYGLQEFTVIMFGLIVPWLLIPITAHLWKRDMRLRGLNF